MNLLYVHGGIERYCLGKRYYSTKGRARAACAAMAAKHKQKFRPYRCPNCGKYHVTHKKDRDNDRAT